jgi:hypothetical protein
MKYIASPCITIYLFTKLLAVEPDTYSPSMDEFGNYVDKVPSAAHFAHGLRCPCGTRRDAILYASPGKFNQHIKSQTPVKWLENINTNKKNYLVENDKLNTTIKTQQQLVIQLSQEVQKQRTIIQGLTQQIGSLTQQIQQWMDTPLQSEDDLLHFLD